MRHGGAEGAGTGALPPPPLSVGPGMGWGCGGLAMSLSPVLDARWKPKGGKLVGDLF